MHTTNRTIEISTPTQGGQGRASHLVRLSLSALEDVTFSKCIAAREAQGVLDGARLTPGELGVAAAEAVRQSGRPLVDLATLRSLRQWWVRCAEEGWFDYHLIDAALAELARASDGSARDGGADALLSLLHSELNVSRRRAG